MTTLNAALQNSLRRRQAPALSWLGDDWTYGDLDAWSAAVANSLLADGVVPGDRVAVGLANSPVLVATVLGVLRAGAVLVPLNPSGPTEDATYAITHSGAALTLIGAEQAERWHSLPGRVRQVDPEPAVGEAAWHPADPGDPALLVYTSGTTGKPKGAALSQAALAGNLRTVADAWRWTAGDRLLLTLPCFHLHGLALGLLGSMLVGSSIVLRARFAADEVPRLLADHRCTLFFGVPTMYNRLVALDRAAIGDLRGMRLWVSGSAPLTEATFGEFRDLYGHEILERFGMSEGGFMIAAPLDATRRPGVVGFPLPGIDVRIADPERAGDSIRELPDGEVGEIVIRGNNLFSGYWADPTATAQAFSGDYFRSGDLALREADGMIRIVGRLSVDIIKCRGFKISAIEIENCLQAHPKVAEVAVVGIPDPDLGEKIVAVVTPSDGESDTVAGEIESYAREHLAGHKVPARIVLMAEIPRTGPGKFKKRALIDDLSAASPD